MRCKSKQYPANKRANISLLYIFRLYAVSGRCASVFPFKNACFPVSVAGFYNLTLKSYNLSVKSYNLRLKSYDFTVKIYFCWRKMGKLIALSGRISSVFAINCLEEHFAPMVEAGRSFVAKAGYALAGSFDALLFVEACFGIKLVCEADELFLDAHR